MEDAVRAIEAILMVSDRPVDPNLLAQVTELATDRVEELCQQLAESYETGGHGFQLVKVAGGWRFQSHPCQIRAKSRLNTTRPRSRKPPTPAGRPKACLRRTPPTRSARAASGRLTSS
jgi:segregation and condensation protein B